MIKLSVAISVRDEEKNLEGCLESIKWADEIVIFDEESADKTVSIAKKYTSSVYLTPHEEMFHKTKQKALEKCKGKWILQIDADERVTPELENEILDIINGNSSYNGYQIPRRNIIFGKWIKHTGWYPDYQIKLFKNGKGHYPCKTLHELIEIEGQIGTLKSDLIHEHYASISQFIDRMNRYTTNDAKYLLGKGESVGWSDAIKYPFDEFLRRFFLWEGYKDGLHGLVLSLLQSFSRLVVFTKIWEEQEFWEYGNDKFLNEVHEKVKVIKKEWHHWSVISTRNPLKKKIIQTLTRLFILFSLQPRCKQTKT